MVNGRMRKGEGRVKLKMVSNEVYYHSSNVRKK